MIQLPTNWRDTIRVIPDTHLLLAYVNANREYFMYVQPIDKAFTIDEVVDLMAQTYPTGKVHTMDKELFVTWLAEPTDQDWLPMPLADTRVISLEQYRAHHQMVAKEDAAAKAAEDAQSKTDEKQ